jgi:hypothetical protein
MFTPVRFGDVWEVTSRLKQERITLEAIDSHHQMRRDAAKRLVDYYRGRNIAASGDHLFPHLDNAYVVISGDHYQRHQPHDQALKDFCRILREDAPPQPGNLPDTLEGLQAETAKIMAEAPAVIETAAKKAFAPLKNAPGGSWKELLTQRIQVFAEDLLAAKDLTPLIQLLKASKPPETPLN